MIEKVLFVAVGGSAGAVARFLLGTWVSRLTGEGYLGTLTVNVSGSFLMGVLAVLLFERFPEDGARLSSLLMTGFLGGFTTFSAFSLDTLYLVERDKLAIAGLYVGSSVALSISGLIVGMMTARAWS